VKVIQRNRAAAAARPSQGPVRIPAAARSAAQTPYPYKASAGFASWRRSEPAAHKLGSGGLRLVGPAGLDAPQLLVCFPPAGATAEAFRAWGPALAPDAAVLAVEYPGRRNRSGEPFAASLGQIAAAVAADLEALGPARVVLLGHAMGAHAAYETARRLGDRVPLAGLIAAAAPAPHLHHSVEPLAPPAEVLLAHDQATVADYRSTPPGGLTAPLLALTGLGAAAPPLAKVEAWSIYSTDFTGVLIHPGDNDLAASQPRLMAAVLGFLRGHCAEPAERCVVSPRGTEAAEAAESR
jgi:pyochelin biosynthetic protein PchC